MSTGNGAPNAATRGDPHEAVKYMDVRTCLSEGTRKVCYVAKGEGAWLA